MAADNNLTITAQAVDNASGPMAEMAQKLADSAAGVAEADRKLIDTSERLTESTHKMHGQFTHAAREITHATHAIDLIGGSAGEGAKIFGEYGSKLTHLAGVLATGGVFGIAVAAAGAAVAGLAFVFETLKSEQENVEKAFAGLEGVAKNHQALINGLTTKTEEYALALRHVGLNALQSALLENQIAMEKADGGANRFRIEIEKLEDAQHKQTEEYKAYLAAVGAGTAHVDQQKADLREELELREKQIEAMRKSASTNPEYLKSLEDEHKAISALMVANNQEASSKEASELRKKAAQKATLDAAKLATSIDLEQQQHAAEESVALWDQSTKEKERILKKFEQEQHKQIEQWLSDREKAAQKEAALAEKIRDIEKNLAVGVTNAWGNAMSEIVSGQKSAGVAIVDAVLATAEKAIDAYAATAAAGAASSEASIPYIGPAVAAAAAASMFGLVRAYIGTLKGFADGGLVTGGIAGQDSVPALLMPGERVLSVAQTRDFDRGAMNAANGSGRQDVHVHVHSATGAPASEAEMDRLMIKHTAPALRRMLNSGALRIPKTAVG